MSNGLVVSQSGSLLSVQLSNQPNNDFTREMCAELTELLSRPPQGSKVLLISSAGDKFCTGRDRSAKGAAEVRSMAHSLAEVNIALVFSQLTVVSKVSGDAAGFGVGLVGLSDLSIASSEANFCFPEVKGGLAPALVLTWLPYVIGRKQSFWMTSTGANISASEAKELGLVNFVVEPDFLDKRTDELVESLLAAPDGVCGQIKNDLINQQWLTMREDSLAAVDRLALRSLMISEERNREK